MEQIYLTTNDKFTAIVQVRSLSNGWRHLHNYGISWKHTGGWTSNLDASQDSYPSNSSSKKKYHSLKKRRIAQNWISYTILLGVLLLLATLAELSTKLFMKCTFYRFWFYSLETIFQKIKNLFFFFCFNCHDFIKIEYFSVERMLLSCTVKCTDQFLIHIYSFGNPNP